MQSTLRLTLLVLGIVIGLGFRVSPALAAGPRHPLIHVVHSGQKLGTIAKRYGVTVTALCRINNIRPTERLRVGERLIIPGRDQVEALEAEPALPEARNEGRPSRLASLSNREEPERTVEHRVYPGQTLAKIAKRYRVSVEDLCRFNDLDCRRPLKPGVVLKIPDEFGSVASTTSVPTQQAPPSRRGQSSKASWLQYATRPKKRGYVTLIGLEESWHGYVLDRRGQVLPRAREGISRVMGATGSRPRADARLCELIARVSDTFGGRSFRVVSGFRRESYSVSSRHRRSQALDFSIPGVPNSVLRDFILGLPNVGVGYYPNSSFVHLDARAQPTHWVDYSGPGEPPRYRPDSPDVEQGDGPPVEDAPQEPTGSAKPSSGTE